MTDVSKLRSEARLLSTEVRRQIISDVPEAELHHMLAELFRAMNPDFWVEVTHGTNEYGKDLVVVRADPLLMDVAGVVVKRGDIKAKTKGDVDGLIERIEDVLSARGEAITQEIIVQVRQSTHHAAELSLRVQNLKCNRVIVILAGSMSGQARRRIQEEVGLSSDVHDLAWLVDAFTAHYPQVFFEARAVDYLYDTIDMLEADSFHSRSGKTLSECFVEPVIAPLDKELSLDDATHLVKVRKRRIGFSQIGSTLAEKRRILLIGDPGCGKSKAVAKYCIDELRQAVNRMTKRKSETEPVGIPIMIPARRFVAFRDSADLLDALLPSTVRGLLRATTLVLDGLDELPSDQREMALQKADDIATSLGTTLLVTSRRLAAFATAPKGFSRCEILPFEVGQAMKLVRKVLLSPDVLPVLRQGIETIHSQLPMNPLSLILLIEVVAERKEVPASLTELYERFLDLVFGRWDHEKGIAVLFEYIVKKRFLATLAYEEFYLKDRLEMSARDFEAFLQRYADEYGWSSEQLRDFVKEVDRAGVLDTSEEVFFRHRSFADFFVGLYLHENRDELGDVKDRVVRAYFDPVWMEAAFFFVGLSRRITAPYLKALVAYEEDGRDLSIERLLMGRLLQAGWYSKAETKTEGVRVAVGYVNSAADAIRPFLRTSKRHVPEVLLDLAVLSLAQHAFGSFAVVKEGAQVLSQLANSGDLSQTGLMQRAALLWSLRNLMDEVEHSEAVRRFVADVTAARLPPADEAKFLVMAGLAADPDADVRRVIGRRIRRIESDKPAAIAALLPGKRPKFLPPRKGR